MANVKSRLKAPKSASTKRGPKTKKSLTGPKKNESLNNGTLCEVVMKRPSTHKVMTPDEKIQYILQNGHKLKEKFIAKPPPNVKCKPEIYPRPTVNRKKNDTSLPIMTKSGHLKKNTKCDMELIDSILKNELMIRDNANTKRSNDTQPLRVPVNNNNDNAITDQNTNASEDYSDSSSLSKYKISSDMCADTSNDFSYGNYSDYSNEKAVKKKVRKEKNKLKQLKTSNEKNKQKGRKTSRPKHVTLSNGVVLNLAYFECDYCKRSFNKKGSLRRHIYMHLGIMPYSCSQCPEKFMSRSNMQIHAKHYHKSTVEDPGLFICNYCDKPFLVKKNLKQHLATHTDTETSFRCMYCSKVFPYHIKLIQHEKKHMVKGYYQCTLCSMSYRDRNRLYLHIKSHLKIKDFVCQYCGKDFLRQNSLTRHLEISHGGHRIVCPICKKNLKGHLTEHMRTHEKKRPHECPDCGQRFTQSTQLNVHRRAHTGAKPYPCRICKRPFSHSNALMLHIRRHTGEKPFPCAMCRMSFSQLPHMKAHMLKIHGKVDPYKCAHCDTFFKLKALLENHEKSCIAGIEVSSDSKKSKQGEEVIEMESAMSLSRMRFLLALLLTMIATKEKLKYLGFNKRLIDDILTEVVEAMDQKPCKDEALSPLKRLKMNIEMLLIGTVPKDQMEKFKNENKSTEDILELLTAEKDM